jgi:hypothetical protein
MAASEGRKTRKTASSASKGAPVDNPELRGSDELRTALITRATFRNKAVQYAVVDGLALFEGDINLGTVEQVEALTEAARSATSGAVSPDIEAAVFISGSQYRWPQGQLPYQIDSGMPNQARVTDAIAHWEANTTIRFLQRTSANAATYPNYVRFFQGDGCYSSVGMQGGMQDISLGAGCTTGNAIHEIGHTVGLWHEQSREDRDSFVVIHWENIQAGKEHNFNQHIADGDDVGGYDYGSIMHYPRDAFSSNGQDTITPTSPASAAIGQRNGLSTGDIAAVASVYGAVVNVKKIADDPFPVKKVVDDNPPRVKKIADDPIQVKKVVDDRPPAKKIFDDPVGVKKISDDRPPPFKKVIDDMVVVRPPWPPIGPGPLTPGLSPFLLATQHHADLGAAAGEEQVAAAQAALQAGIQAAADAVSAAERNVIALQTALTGATAALAKAQQDYAAAIQMLGSA